MKVESVQNFQGGLSLVEPTNIEDNQFEVLKNMFYNKDKRIETRRGITTFGKPIPDNSIVLNACDATTNFAVADDATTLATGTAIRGTNSVSFTIDVSNSGNDYSTLTNASLGTIDISNGKGYLGFWLYVPSGFNTDLTDVKVRLGSDSSNYYEWTLSTLTEASNNFIALNYDDAVTNGTPVDTSIDYFRLQITYTASYTDKEGILVDAIQTYSATSLKPVTSYFFFQRDDTLTTTALAVAGTFMYKYDETSTYWEMIDSGLTEYETQTGRTTERTRWDFAVYKNVIYMCNGVDNYRSWDGTVITEYAAQPKVRYLRYMGDRIFGAGDDSNPSSLYYTAAAPADATTINTNVLVVGGDELGRINGLFDLGQIILAFKSKKIYSVNVAASSVSGIDTQNGGYSDRAIDNVGNSLVYYNDTGIDTLKQKSGATGSEALESLPLTNDLRELTKKITPKQYNANCGYYALPLNNYYFSFDTTNDNIPETTLVLSSLVSAWSEYNYPATYDYGFYIDSDGVEHYVIASATGGQIFEIETGFSDNGVDISYELKTKRWDFGEPGLFHTYKFIDIIGLKSEGQDITVEVIVDGAVQSTSTIDDTKIDKTGSVALKALGGSVLGTKALTGDAREDDLDLYKYLLRVPMYTVGENIQVRMYSNSGPIVWTLDKIRIGREDEMLDIFPTVNIG